MIKAVCIAMGLALAAGTAAAETFRFEAQASLDDMRALVQRQFSATPTREQVRAVFVGEGGATLIGHPRRQNVEKYVYDINLCSYYVWRWNISADYGVDGTLQQIYVNGSPALHGASLARHRQISRTRDHSIGSIERGRKRTRVKKAWPLSSPTGMEIRRPLTT